MADSMLRMDWLSPNIGEAFLILQDLYFSVKKINAENQVNHILLAVGDEGLKRFNSWNLSAVDRKPPKQYGRNLKLNWSQVKTSE